MPRKSPSPDCLIPVEWLNKLSVSDNELSDWTSNKLAGIVTVHGGARFIYFLAHQRPLKFREVNALVAECRSKFKDLR